MSTLSTTNIKHPSSGSNNLVLTSGGATQIAGLTYPTADGSNGQYLRTNGSGALSFATVAGVSVAVIADQKANDTNGGSFIAGAWRTRDLNTEISDSSSIVSIASNRFTLIPGTYIIEFAAPAFGVSHHRVRLYDITNSAVIALGISSIDYADANLIADGGISTGAGVVSIVSNTTYEIQHRCAESKVDNGFGAKSSFGASEQYTTVTILKVA